MVFGCIETHEYKDAVIEFRRKVQRMNKQQVVFIDSTGIQEQARPLSGLAAPGLCAAQSVSPSEREALVRLRADRGGRAEEVDALIRAVGKVLEVFAHV